MSRRALWISSGFAVALGAVAVLAFSTRERARTPAPAGDVRSAPSDASTPATAGPAIAAPIAAAESIPEPAVAAAQDVRVRELMRMLIRNERDETGRQIAISRVRSPLPDPEKQRQLEIDELEAAREARSLGLANSDFVAAKRAELTATRNEDAEHFSRRVATEERALLADEYLTEYFVRRYLASTQLPNGMPLAEIYSGMRSSVAGLTAEQRADSLSAAHAEFGDLPATPSYSVYPEQGWNHPPSPEGG
jgi:hypothetical protein